MKYITAGEFLDICSERQKILVADYDKSNQGINVQLEKDEGSIIFLKGDINDGGLPHYIELTNEYYHEVHLWRSKSNLDLYSISIENDDYCIKKDFLGYADFKQGLDDLIKHGFSHAIESGYYGDS